MCVVKTSKSSSILLEITKVTSKCSFASSPRIIHFSAAFLESGGVFAHNKSFAFFSFFRENVLIHDARERRTCDTNTERVANSGYVGMQGAFRCFQRW